MHSAETLNFMQTMREGGDCMFYALQHQLLTHGIEIDASIIRQQVVEFLGSDPTLTTPDGNVVTFSDFIHNKWVECIFK